MKSLFLFTFGAIIGAILMAGVVKTSTIKLDLPEEISQATSNDTLIAIKKGNTIFIEFKN